MFIILSSIKKNVENGIINWEKKLYIINIK